MDDKQKKLTFGIGALFVFVIVFFIGKQVGQLSPSLQITMSDGTPVSAKEFEPFWKVWSVISEKYVSATTTDSKARIWGAIKGLASSQGDPYTVFFPPEENKTFKSDIAGNFEGVGMELGIKDNIITVVTPLKNSPAERAGIMVGDRIIKINDQSTMDLSIEGSVKLIRGPKGTPVKITVIREGVNQPIEKTLVRDIIDIPTIETEIKNITPTNNTSTSTVSSLKSNSSDTIGLRSDGVYIIRLFSFTAQSPDLFRVALRKFLDSGSHKLLIDLRGNPGGYLDAAVDIASWFLPAGKLIVTEDFGGRAKNKEYLSKGYNVLDKLFGAGNYSVIILVNGGSASASEILAGALREHGVAKLVGNTTFGKGSVQELVEITNDTSLKVTIARWLTPKGHNLSKNGLVPDVEVKVTQKDIDSKNDVQLNKAVDILKNEK